jgi:hypothetical protein
MVQQMLKARRDGAVRFGKIVVYNGGFGTDGTSGLSYFNFASVVEIRLWFFRSYFNLRELVRIMFD